MGNLEQIQKLKAELAEAEAAELKRQQEEALFTEPAPKKTIPLEPKTEGTQVYSNISKKTAAVEIINRDNTAKIYIIISIIAPFLILIAALFNRWVSMGVAFVAIIPSALFLYKLNTEIARLKQEYGVR